MRHASLLCSGSRGRAFIYFRRRVRTDIVTKSDRVEEQSGLSAELRGACPTHTHTHADMHTLIYVHYILQYVRDTILPHLYMYVHSHLQISVWGRDSAWHLCRGQTILHCLWEICNIHQTFTFNASFFDKDISFQGIETWEQSLQLARFSNWRTGDQIKSNMKMSSLRAVRWSTWLTTLQSFTRTPR